MEEGSKLFGRPVEKFDRRSVLALAFIAMACGSNPSKALAEDSNVLPLSGPAELVRSMRLPGANDPIRRPMALFVDHRHGEVFVGDTMSNRVLVFDRDGLYRYQFDCADHIGSPLGISVDSEGHVFVLGSTRDGQRVVKFDFDGMYLGVLDVSDLGSGSIQGFTIDADDHLVLVDNEAWVHVIESDGKSIRRIDVGTAVSADQRRELILGQPLVRDRELWIPASNRGSVLVFDVDSGDFVRSVGFRGNTPGQLNFPVAVDVTSEGIVLVLDRMRFAVVCYSLDGRFLGEFGGKGFRDGWFYHPSLLAVSDVDHVVVGQMLDGRIQLCRIPRYVRTRLVQGSPVHRADDDGNVQAHDVGVSTTTLRSP